jgi:5'-3' exonuclease
LFIFDFVCPSQTQNTFEGIIHGCSHNNNKDADDDTETVSHVTEAEIFRNVCYYLDRIVKDVAKPTQLVYMAIDGVAPRAKLNQQRSRRYRSGKEGEIETTIYDAHMKNLADEKSRNSLAVAEEFGLDGNFVREEGVLSDSDEDDSNNSTSNDSRVDGNRNLIGEERSEEEDYEDTYAVEEVEPGRFAGKFLATLESIQKTTTGIAQGGDGTGEGSNADPLEANSANNSNNEPLFHSNSITPGTPFFARCTAAIEHFIRYKISADPAWQKLQVVFSGPNVPGEGAPPCLRDSCFVIPSL